MAFTPTDSEKGRIFKALVTKTYAQVAEEFKLSTYLSSKGSIMGTLSKIVSDVKKDPGTFRVTPEEAKMVIQAIDSRRRTPAARPTEVSTSDLLNPEDTRAVVIGGRNKAAMLLHNKMDYLAKNKKALQSENLVSLAKVFGIFFDKAQILSGEATENIAILAKVSDDMSAAESLQALLKMREVNQTEAVEKAKPRLPVEIMD